MRQLDAFDDKLAETSDDDLDENELTPDQFQLCEQVGVLPISAKGWKGGLRPNGAPTPLSWMPWRPFPARSGALEWPSSEASAIRSAPHCPTCVAASITSIFFMAKTGPAPVSAS